MRLSGIHHITGMARDGDACVEFYCNILGLRLVKITVNYDDPGSYHIYFGDYRASPGTLLTFFLWPDVAQRPSEDGQVERIAYAIPRGSINFWRERLAAHGAKDAERGIRVRDPDGLAIDLIEADAKRFDGIEPPKGVPDEYAIGPFYGATFAESDPEEIADRFNTIFGMERMEPNDRATVMALADGAEIELVQRENAEQRARVMAPGVIHHIAFRAADDDEQTRWRQRVIEHGLRPTTVRERTYFRSIYFREPGGVLFEIATEGPGMTADEPFKALGGRLVLPKWLEGKRGEIERALPALEILSAKRAR